MRYPSLRDVGGWCRVTKGGSIGSAGHFHKEARREDEDVRGGTRCSSMINWVINLPTKEWIPLVEAKVMGILKV